MNKFDPKYSRYLKKISTIIKFIMFALNMLWNQNVNNIRNGLEAIRV